MEEPNTDGDASAAPTEQRHLSIPTKMKSPICHSGEDSDIFLDSDSDSSSPAISPTAEIAMISPPCSSSPDQIIPEDQDEFQTPPAHSRSQHSNSEEVKTPAVVSTSENAPGSVDLGENSDFRDVDLSQCSESDFEKCTLLVGELNECERRSDGVLTVEDIVMVEDIQIMDVEADLGKDCDDSMEISKVETTSLGDLIEQQKNNVRVPEQSVGLRNQTTDGEQNIMAEFDDLRCEGISKGDGLRGIPLSDMVNIDVAAAADGEASDKRVLDVEKFTYDGSANAYNESKEDWAADESKKVEENGKGVKSSKNIEDIDKFRYDTSEVGYGKWKQNHTGQGSSKSPLLRVGGESSVEGRKKEKKMKKKLAKAGTKKEAFVKDLLNVLKRVAGEHRKSEDLLKIAKSRGMTFPRPRWWSPDRSPEKFVD